MLTNELNKSQLYETGGQPTAIKLVNNDSFLGVVNLNLAQPNFTMLFDTMRANFWIPNIFNQTAERRCWEDLDLDHQFQFLLWISYLTNLDSVQMSLLPNISTFIAPGEVKLCVGEQTAQEGLHTQSYQFIAQSILPQEEVSIIYSLVDQGDSENWTTKGKFLSDFSNKFDFAAHPKLPKYLKRLHNHFDFIAKPYKEFPKNPTLDTFSKVLLCDLLLEGLYFNSGFYYFYELANQSLMPGSKTVISLIDRDERTHVALFSLIIKWFRQDYKDFMPESFIYDLFEKAYEEELDWLSQVSQMAGVSVFSDAADRENYIKYRLDKLCRLIGVNPMYNVTKNPYQNLADMRADGNELLYSNFFESTIVNYQSAVLFADFDKV